MARLLTKSHLSIAAMLACCLCVAPASAAVHMFILHDHPDGAAVPPEYGLRIDNLIGTGVFTFSFDHFDGSETANVMLTYDDVLEEIHITGRAYGGEDTGAGWDVVLQGWIVIDFTYSQHVSVQDNCGGDPGNDIYVTGESASNSGTITLDGWGGGGVYAFEGKADASGCAFILDNDTDSKGNSAIADDPTIWSGSGWLMPTTSGFRDWLFIAENGTVPVEESSWGAMKALYTK